MNPSGRILGLFNTNIMIANRSANLSMYAFNTLGCGMITVAQVIGRSGLPSPSSSSSSSSLNVHHQHYYYSLGDLVITTVVTLFIVRLQQNALVGVQVTIIWII